jgi:hypothetical protein
MDTNQPTVQTNYAPTSGSPGIFGGKIPSSVAFVAGVLLFLMPFIDIKCNNMSIQQVSGVQLATGFKTKNSSSDNPFLNDIKNDKVDSEITKATTKTEKKDPNMYALIALGLGVLGLLLSFTNAKAAVGGAMVTGIASAGAMVGLMLDIKKKIKLPKLEGDNDISKGLGKIGDTITDSARITVDFTPWFYIAIIAFLAAAFFCYKRMSVRK